MSVMDSSQGEKSPGYAGDPTAQLGPLSFRRITGAESRVPIALLQYVGKVAVYGATIPTIHMLLDLSTIFWNFHALARKEGGDQWSRILQ